MALTAHRRRRRLVILLAVGFGLLAALIGVGIYGLTLAPAPDAGTPAGDPTAPEAAPAVPTPTSSADTLPAIASTTDAEEFARDAAEALITWDTTAFELTAYAQVIVDAGDPSGFETAALASDVRSYFPTPDAWAQLRTYGTRQWLTIDDVYIPASWDDALDQAADGDLLPGTIAYTISGTRHRAGVVGTEAQETSRPIAFTMFIACEPSFAECHLLRLSEVDNPLR
ncbi:hypothetical protein ACFC1I_03260 [Microbacterium sp. NPDC056044]|uniref:hypothetical protein n=1 Tax=Microbacterium sp. NPDC056044 TaxID=3345690 RepID=UPI0035E07A54